MIAVQPSPDAPILCGHGGGAKLLVFFVLSVGSPKLASPIVVRSIAYGLAGRRKASARLGVRVMIFLLALLPRANMTARMVMALPPPLLLVT